MTGIASLAVPSLLMAQGGSACPMPLEAQLKSIRAFAPIHSFATKEPRCVNCHGAVNPHIDGTGSEPGEPDEVPSTIEHGGGAIGRMFPRRPSGAHESLEMVTCAECHDNMAPRRDGSKSRWFTAPSFLAFLGKDAATLCKQFKRSTESADRFIGHLQDDNGADNFGHTAFSGNRGLDLTRFTDVRPEPPSISHSTLMRMGREWIDAMGGRFQGDENCGCEVKLEGKFTQIDSSPMDSIRITGDLVWKSVDDSSGAAPAPGAPLVFKPHSGHITVALSFNAPGIASHCEGTGQRTFDVASMARGALQHLKLEIDEDARYKLSLVIRDRPDPFPTWTMDGRCIFPNVASTAPMQVKYMSVILGRQQGTLDPERGIVGELPAPIRQGPRTINGNWSFTAKRQ